MTREKETPPEGGDKKSKKVPREKKKTPEKKARKTGGRSGDRSGRGRGGGGEKTEKKPKKKRRRFRPRLLWIPAAVILAAAGGGAALRWKFGPGLGIIKTTRETALETTEFRAEDLARFFTLEFVWKTVFPHDFFPPQEEWDAFLHKKRYYLPMTEADAELNRLYQLCQETGFSTRREDSGFMVLTVVIKAGFDWAENRFPGNQESDPSGEASAPPMIVEGRRISLEIPRVRVLQTILEDPERESYPFPDVRLSPESLRKIAGYVSSKAEDLAAERNLLDRAEENGRAALTELFTKAGFEEVNFR